MQENTWTVLHRPDIAPWDSFVTHVRGESYDEAEEIFEVERPEHTILAIYKGKVSHSDATAQYIEENN